MSDPSLDDLMKAANIRKIEAEAAALGRSPPLIWSNWISPLAGLAGVAALLTAVGALFFQAWNHNIDLEKATLAAKGIELESREQALQYKETAQKAKAELVDNLARLGEVTKQLDEKQKLLNSIAQAPGTSATDKVKLEAAATDLGTLAAQVKLANRQLVYIQFRGDLSRPTVREFQSVLNGQGYSAPGVERVDNSFSSSVKYFKPSDEKAARLLAKAASDFFSHACKIPVTFAASYEAAPRPPPQIEVWINLNCPAAG